MTVNTQNVWFISGASSGLGKSLAEAVIANGDKAIITARRLDRLEAIAAGHEGNVLPLAMDVTDEQARNKAIAQAIRHFGRIDVLANMAGSGVAGACEEFSLSQMRQQMELNFFATAELTKAVLPQMRKQGCGNILTVSSIVGLVAMNAAGPYCAAKFAIEGWTESLALEVKHMGIDVTLIEPGAFRTEFAGDANMRPEHSIEAYRPVVEPFETYLKESAGKQMGDPAKAAQRMLEVVASDNAPYRLMLGRDAYSMWDNTINKRLEDISSWRERGENTAFDDAQMVDIQL
ncbi:SDR family NAD(P)-dependent oxidoreductase [Vibrio fluvialis]|nr:SDR family NAD(P)-dependent oxidoreductase [Vibrio fluvialis]ELI1831895.1 SDR family NAD(P)-dependent oxidoreductase [Vibrio fluvialis]